MPKTYDYILIKSKENILKKIYKTEFSSAEIYLKPYNNSKSIKVLTLEDDEPIGDISPQAVKSVLANNFNLGEVSVDIDFNEDGNTIYNGIVTFEKMTKEEIQKAAEQREESKRQVEEVERTVNIVKFIAITFLVSMSLFICYIVFSFINSIFE